MLNWNVEGDFLFEHGGAGQVEDRTKTGSVSRPRCETDIPTRSGESGLIPRRRISRTLAAGEGRGIDCRRMQVRGDPAKQAGLRTSGPFNAKTRLNQNPNQSRMIIYYRYFLFYYSASLLLLLLVYPMTTSLITLHNTITDYELRMASDS